jgi:putative iron-dependent peroxidase
MLVANRRESMLDPQPAVNAAQTRCAIFVVLTVRNDPAAHARVRQVCGDVAALTRAVGNRDNDGHLSCAVGFGSAVWDRLFGQPRPRELHPFRELRSGPRYAPSTPGDLWLHIRSERDDMCYELAAQIMARLGETVTSVDETHGFRYFDDRDLTGFVDGTENPPDAEKPATTLVAAEDPAFAGGSYVMVQKYIHDMPAWHKLTTETQEGIIGRTKLDDIELDDATKPAYAHNALTTLVENGEEIKILRHNMPFGMVTSGEAGTYFVGYARSLHPLEAMLEAMVIGRPPGNYDRLLDFTHPVSGSNFFVPSAQFLAALASGPEPEPLAPAAATARARERKAPGERPGTLNIGSLKGVTQREQPAP